MNGQLFCFVVNRAKRLNDMVAHLDVDTSKLVRLEQGAAYDRARVTCLQCPEAEVCLDWVETAPKGARPEFCPSLALFDSVRRM